MSNLGSLLKIAFYNNTGINGLSKSIKDGEGKRKLLFTSCMFIFAAIIIAVMAGSYSYGLSELLIHIGQLDLLMVVTVIVISLIILITTIYKAPGILFSAKDYELLMSLPIKQGTILCSKLMEMMIMNYIFTVLIMVPSSVVYFIRSGNTKCTFFLFMVIGLIFIPMIPVVVASIMAVIIGYLSSKFKHKNIMSIIIGLLVTIIAIYGSIRIQDIINYFVANGSSITQGFERAYPPAKYLANAMINFNIISLIKFIIVSIIPFIIFIAIFSKTFNKINKVLGESYKESNYKLGKLKTSTVVVALTKEELKKYFSISIYVTNTLIGMILVLAAAVLSLFKGDTFVNTLLEIPNIRNIISCGALLIIIFGIGISCTTASSISIEGKNLWIKKTLPISEKDIFLGKIFTNLVISIPIAILSNLLFYIGLKFDFIYLILNLIITMIFSILSAIIGLVINLYFPKLNWSSATVVVKQSAAVLINMIVTFAVIVLPIVALAIFKVENMVMSLSVLAVIFILVTFAVWKVLMTKGVKQFNSL